MTYSWTPAEDQQRSTESVPNAPFWPAMNVATFCTEYAVPAALDNGMIANALMVSAAKVNRQLKAFKAAATDMGHTTLDAMDAHEIGGADVLVMFYLAAVYNTAMARLVMLQPMTADDDRAQQAAQYTAAATAAIAEINGEPATGVHII